MYTHGVKGVSEWCKTGDAPGGILKGNGVSRGSASLPLKLTSLGTFLFSDKKVPPPAGTGTYNFVESVLVF